MINYIYIVVVAAILLKLAVQLRYDWLNLRAAKVQRNQLPKNLEGLVTPEAHAKSADYTTEHNTLGIAETIYAAAIKLTLLSCGLLPFLYNGTVTRWGVHNAWAQALLMSVLGIAISVLYWPFEWLSTFGIEAKYGFNRETPWIWLSDQLKGWLLTLVLAVPITAGLLWLASSGMINWWLTAFAVVMAYEIFLTFVYPNFIEPMFNKFTPLPEGELKNRIEELCTAANVKVKKILVMDASRRSSHANAYFAGIGAARRIVLYDTLIAQLTTEEVAAVLAHEVGHMKHQHTLRGMYVGAASQLVGFFLTGLLAAWPRFYSAFGFTIDAGVGGAFLLISLIGGLFSFWLIPGISAWHRLHEYEADAYAAKMVGSPQPLILGLKKLTKESLASVEDDARSHSFYASHPTLKEREERMLAETVKI